MDEAGVQARAEFAATLSLQTQASYTHDAYGRQTRLQTQALSPNASVYTEQTSVAPQLVLTQPLFTSGRISADIKAAGAQVKADRQALRIAEGTVLFNVIQAYADVVRDRAALDIRKLNLDMLHRQLAETQAMQRAGEITRTDVAQIEAALATEEDLNNQATAQLEVSRANYAAVVGHTPDGLAPLPDLGGRLGSASDIIASAEADNPQILQALYIEEVSHARIYAAKANQGISVNAQIQGGYQGAMSPFYSPNLDRVVTATVNVTVPLSTGGQLSSLTRQAYDQNTVDKLNVESVHRTVIKAVATAWQQWHAAQQSVETEDRAVKSAAVAFEGMGKEYKVAQRSTLDVLLAEETQRNAELALNTAKHDAYLYEASLLQVMGRLEITNLTTVEHPYDPGAHLKSASPQVSPTIDAPLEAIDGLANGPVKPVALTPTAGENARTPEGR